MNSVRNKTKLTAAVTIVLLMATSMLIISPAKAQTYTNMQEGGSIPLPTGVTPDLSLNSLAYLSFRPNPVGVGQQVLVNLWVQPPLHVSRYFKDAFQVTITKQDGTKIVKTVSSYRADSTGWFEFIADQVGNWTLKFEFLGAYFPPGNYTVEPGAWVGGQVVSFTQSCYYKPSASPERKLVVQEEPVTGWPAAPLPTDYWTRPVSPENREWWTILGNFPATGFLGGGSLWPAKTNKYSGCASVSYAFTPYVQAPNTAHIVWKRQGAFGGLYGPGFEQDSMTSGGGTPTIIYQGRCYQTITKVMPVLVNGTYYNQPTSAWQCYDLRTGEVYWEQTGVPAATWIFYEPGWPEVPGGDPSFGRNAYLGTISGGRLLKYSPYTGAVAQNVSISPMTTGTYYACTDFPYFYSVQNLGGGIFRLINWTVRGDPGSAGATINVGLRIISNISWPFSSVGTVDYETGVAVTTTGVTHPAAGSGVSIDARIMGASLYNLSPGTNNLLWNVSSTVGFGTFPASLADRGKWAARFNDGKWHCYSLQDGRHLWASEETSYPWGTFGCYGVQSFGGMIISNQYDGVAAYDWETGKVVWFYKYVAEYPLETPYEGSYPWFTGVGQIADGKLYTYNTEHTATQPLTRGWKMHCINITTGKGIWSIAGAMSPGAVADGYLTASNTYDGYMYVFGKGKSATAVTAPDIPIVLGSSLVIRGTVLDQSPASKGVACVSDESMSAWMEYLHLQRPMPKDVKGVTVSLDVIDANGNYRNIGKATTDASGAFSLMWKPDIPGKYTLIATFAGSESYGSSFSTTAFGVVEAPPELADADTDTSNVVSFPPIETYFIGATAVIVLAIAVVGFLILRKRS